MKAVRRLMGLVVAGVMVGLCGTTCAKDAVSDLEPCYVVRMLDFARTAEVAKLTRTEWKALECRISQEKKAYAQAVARASKAWYDIAAYACVLLLHRDTGYYPLLVTILVYPHTFVVSSYQAGPAGQVLESTRMLVGESWRHGNVVLAWDEVQHSAFDLHDGRNVVFHEFAHQLDEEDGSANGAPLLPRRSMYGAWARILGEDYAELVRDAEAGRSSCLDQYGATNPAEFFAVATESFFENPVMLRDRHPRLYAELRLYYQQDPAARGGRVSVQCTRSVDWATVVEAPG